MSILLQNGSGQVTSFSNIYLCRLNLNYAPGELLKEFSKWFLKRAKPAIHSNDSKREKIKDLQSRWIFQRENIQIADLLQINLFYR